MLITEPCACTANATHNFVDVKQDVVFFADLSYARPVAFWGFDHATTSGHWFKAKCANGVGTFAQDDLFDLIRSPFTVVLNRCAILFVLAVLKAVRHADEARSEWTVLCVALVLATCGHGCDC